MRRSHCDGVGGSETQTSGILSSQPEAQYAVSSALRRIHRWLELPGCFRGGELGRAQIGDTERWGGVATEKKSGDSSLLRAVYMADHQRNSTTIEQRGAKAH